MNIQDAKARKSPATRLLDLLAGWAEFAGNDEESGIIDPMLSSEEIADLYQAAGAQSLQWDSLDEAGEERAVREFIETRVFPLLNRRQASARQLAVA